MKPRTLILLVVIVLACAGYIVYRHTDWFRTPHTPTTSPATKLVLGEKLGEISRLAIVAGDGGKIVLAKTGRAWRVEAPFDAPADAEMVVDVVSLLKALKYQRTMQADAEAEKLAGMDRPLWTLTLTDKAGATHTLQVGHATLSRRQTYVRTGGSKTILVADADLESILYRKAGDYRDRTVASFKPRTVDAVNVSGRYTYRIERHNRRWHIVKPFPADADGRKVRDKLLLPLSNLRASGVVTDDPAAGKLYGLDKPQLTVRLELAPKQTTTPASKPAAGQSITIDFGNSTRREVFVRRHDSPVVFKLDAAVLDKFPKPDDIRERSVLRIGAEKITAMELSLPGGKVKLQLKDDEWMMLQPFPGQADAGQIRMLLSRIASLKAKRFIDRPLSLTGYGLQPARATLRLQAGKNEARTLLIGNKNDEGETFTMSASGPAVAIINTADIKPLLAAPPAYWNPKLIELPADARISEITLKRGDGISRLVREQSGWMLQAPKKGPADKDKVNRILDRLETLIAGEIVSLSSKAPQKYAKAKDKIKVTFKVSHTGSGTTSTTATKKEPQTYRLTLTRVGGDTYAWVDSPDCVAVGRFAASLYDDLNAELAAKLQDK